MGRSSCAWLRHRGKVGVPWGSSGFGFCWGKKKSKMFLSFWWTLSPASPKPWLSHHCCTQGTGGYHSAGLDKSQYKIGTKYRMLQFAILPLLQSQSRDETFFQTQTRTRISQWNLCPSWASRQRLQKSCDTIKKYTSWLDKLSVGRKRPKSNRSLCWQQVCLKRASSPYETLCARRLLPCHFRHIRSKAMLQVHTLQALRSSIVARYCR